DAGVLEAPRELERGELGGRGPALDRDLAVAGVEPDRDPAGKFSRGVPDQRRVAHGGGADDDAGDALAEPGLDGGEGADAAAELQRDGDAREKALDRLRIHRLAGEGAVEIDDVQIFKALLLKRLRLRRRIAVEHGGARHVALLEPHAGAVLEVDGGKENHG